MSRPGGRAGAAGGSASVAAASPTVGYTLSATPQSKAGQNTDKCNILTLTNTGLKGVTSATSGYTAANCW